MELQDVLFNNRILYLSRGDLIDAGLLDYTAVVEDVRRGLWSRQLKETISKKLAPDFDNELILL